MRSLLSALALASAAIPAAAPQHQTPRHLVQFQILSPDATRPVTAHVRLTGNVLYALGAARAPGRVVLSGDTGSVTTPGLLEVRQAAGAISFQTAPGDPEVVLIAAASPDQRSELYARGHSVRVGRDSSGRLRVIAPTLRSRAP